MPEIDLGPQLAPDDKLRFLDSHRPALDDGAYTVTVTHRLEIGGKAEVDAARSLRFLVAGPRFVLAPDEVASRFPPPGASGEFSAVLPHVVLRRASLPWERSATTGSGRDGPPWLALLVLDEGEIVNSTTVPASSLITTAVGAALPPLGPAFATLPRAPDDDPNQAVAVIDIAADVAANILPDAAELPFLTGVRDVNATDPRALVVANRLPAAGKRNHVHLVSLEHQYRPAASAGAQPTIAHWAAGVNTGTVRFVSLAQWDFFCEGAGGDLGAILQGVSIRRLGLGSKGIGPSTGAVEAGAVPLEYRLATGERTAAWYHGPLAVRDHGAVLALPARHAGDLLLLERATGMPDISYAAAWELGRMLALRDPAVGVRLHQWKREVVQAGAAADWLDDAPEAMPTNPSCPLFPLGAWFENALSRLAAVPFSYLVPEPLLLLPAETLSLFALDRQWIAALFDGAFSIGRTSVRQQKLDAGLRAVLPAIPRRSGMLLRSAAVAGWPDLVVDGVAQDGARLKTLRFERLAKDTLIVLFEGDAAAVEVHPHPQALHFGFDGSAASGLSKRGQSVAFRKGDARTVEIAALARALAATGSHDFTQQMIEGVPKVSYSVVRPQVSHV